MSNVRVFSLARHGVGERTVQTLIQAGVGGLAHLIEMSDEELQGLEGISAKNVEEIRAAAEAARLEWDAHDAAVEAEQAAAEQAEAEQAAAEQAAAEREADGAEASEEAPAAAEAPAGTAGEEERTDVER